MPQRRMSAAISKVRAVVFGYWNEPVSVEMAAKRFSAIASSSGKILALEQLEKNLAGRGRDRIDVNQIAVARVARVMIDVDPKLSRCRSPASGVPSRCRVAVSSASTTSKSSGSLGGKETSSPPGRKENFSSKTFFVPNFHFLAQLLERKAHRDLAAERVAIRAGRG